eukprot:12182340-Alexandrium_andersonii.AAC.1
MAPNAPLGRFGSNSEAVPRARAVPGSSARSDFVHCYGTAACGLRRNAPLAVCVRACVRVCVCACVRVR